MKTQTLLRVSLFFALAVMATSGLALAESTSSSITQLLASGQSVACSYEKDDEHGHQKGIFYVAQNRMRGDIDVTDPKEGVLPMHMIRDGEWMYTWGDAFGQGQGMKMNATAAGRSAAEHGHGPDPDEEMAMDCNPWPVDNSKFNIPQDVQFNDLSSMMGGLGMAQGASGGQGLDMKALQCAACDQAPAEEKAQCLQMLGCS